MKDCIHALLFIKLKGEKMKEININKWIVLGISVAFTINSFVQGINTRGYVSVIVAGMFLSTFFIICAIEDYSLIPIEVKE